MSRRPPDWSPLAGSDPVPGDPVVVRRVGHRYRETASALAEQSARLRALAGDRGWDSDAGEQWRHQGREVSGRLGTVVERYQAAGEALVAYASALELAQSQSRSALELAQQAEREQRSARAALEAAARAHAAAPPDTPPPDTRDLHRRLERAAADLAAARAQLRRAEHERDRAAEAASGRISQVTGSDGLDDGRFAGARRWVGDRVEWVDRNLKTITDWAGRVALVAGVLALAVGWIPVVGQLAAAVLTAVAVLASLVALAGSLVMALQGRGSWLDVGLNVFAVATLGVGRVAAAGLRASAQGTRATAQAARQQQVYTALTRGKPVSPKRQRTLEIRARREAKQIPGGGLHRAEVEQALARGPRFLPPRAELAHALDPRVVAREAAEGVARLRPGQGSWSAAAERLPEVGLAPSLLDEATRSARATVAQLPADLAGPAAALYAGAVARQYTTLVGVTTSSIVAGGLAETRLPDRLRVATVTPPS